MLSSTKVFSKDNKFKYSKGDISLADLKEIECSACPSEGSCAGLFTANTMSTAIEALGMALPGDSSIPAPDGRKVEASRKAGEAVMNLLEKEFPRITVPN